MSVVMRRIFICALAIVLYACGGKSGETESTVPDSSAFQPDASSHPDREPTDDPTIVNSNERFRDVRIEAVGQDRYRVTGEARVFEATVDWVVEDGHRELKKGFTTAERGAPEWGAFDFIVEVRKDQPNSTLLLILFETSAKDGTRQHELPLPLE